jgi:glycosyltransferase involved in cell wall biosynthesis
VVDGRYRIGFVMEHTLGHVTHAQNFRARVEQDPSVEATWLPVVFDEPHDGSGSPLILRNWTLRASWRARRQVQAVLHDRPLDALFFHTQVTALFAHGLMKRVPTIVSMDATPINFDSIGAPYHHVPSKIEGLEALKTALNRRTFTGARRLVVWHQWGKQSLESDYGQPPDKIDVIPPGVELGSWTSVRPAPTGSRGDRPIRLLFVGGQFRRKGGDILLASYGRDLMQRCCLDIVTRDAVDLSGLRGVTVYTDLEPNDPRLRRLYAEADIFVLPTFADTLPLVVMEAMASGLPVIATAVGAITEEVDDGVNGLVIQPGDADALSQAVLRLVDQPDWRMRMGEAARRTAEERFDAARNYPRILDLCKRTIDSGHH